MMMVNSVDKIMDGLYLGDINGASNLYRLKQCVSVNLII